VKGLDAFPRDAWPNPLLVHLAFQAMVGLGTALAALSLGAGVLALRARGVPTGRRFLGLVAAAGPVGFLALEAGWLVTEWGRQPFTVWGVMRTADSVTPVRALAVPFATFTALYLFLAAAVVVLLSRQIAHAPRGSAGAGPARGTAE
jgi:cytochrome d ubiquinol oxidase subunit I